MLVHVEIPDMSLNLQDPLLRLTGIHPRQTGGPLFCQILTDFARGGRRANSTPGPARGKSHLIKAIHNMANLVFRKARQSPSENSALFMAPTGTAAFNIGSPTIHSALLMPLKMKTYIKLTDDKCNTLKTKLQS